MKNARVPKKAQTSWLYYSGNSVHPFFKEEYNALKDILSITPSNISFDAWATQSTPVLVTKNTTATNGMQNEKGVVHKYKSTSKIVRVARWCALEVWCWLGLPKMTWVSNATDAKNIWSCGYLILNKPYIVTFEDSSVFFFHRYHLCNRGLIKLWTNWLLSRKNCLAIVPWTNAAKQSFTTLFPSPTLAKKIHVLYPTISPTTKTNQLPFSKRKHILFVGQAFIAKGGYDLLYALQRVPHIKAEIVSVNYPQKAKELAAKLPNVTLHQNISRKQLEELHKHARIFVLPTHMDTLGFSYLEAMSYGTPCIGLKHFATPEIITHNKTGIIVPTTLSYFDKTFVNRANGGNTFWKEVEQPNEKTISALAHAIDTIYTDEKKWNAMSKATLVQLETGTFSKRKWTAQVKKITDK